MSNSNSGHHHGRPQAVAGCKDLDAMPAARSNGRVAKY